MNFKGDFFLGHPVCRSQLQKKKSGVKKCLEICAIKDGGAGVTKSSKNEVFYKAHI